MKFKYDGEGERLDKFLAGSLEDVSRSRLQKMIKVGDVLVNGKNAKGAYILKEGDEILVGDIKEKEIVLKAEDIDLEVLYEDKAVLAINKPAGMIVHPSDNGENLSGTVANAMKGRVEGDGLRPGIVHRLDKDTSGILLIAKTEAAREYLVEQFKGREVKKTYIALVSGILGEKEGVIDSPIWRSPSNRKKMALAHEGKEAVSQYKVLEEFHLGDADVSLVEVEIKTGRTHQIRVHMAGIGHSVIGDEKYGNKKINKFFKEKYGLNRQFLHAEKVKFRSPDKDKIISLECPLPSSLEFLSQS